MSAHSRRPWRRGPRGRASTCRGPRRTLRAALATLSTFPFPENPLTRTGGLLYVFWPVLLLPKLLGPRARPSGANLAQDITARSPVIGNEPLTRQSLDSARLYRAPRSVADRRVDHQPPTPEECFEDIGLDDNKQQQPRKRGFFSKFGEQPDRDSTGQAGVSRFLMHGRKRGQSGQGSELGQIERPRASVEARP